MVVSSTFYFPSQVGKSNREEAGFLDVCKFYTGKPSGFIFTTFSLLSYLLLRLDMKHDRQTDRQTLDVSLLHRCRGLATPHHKRSNSRRNRLVASSDGRLAKSNNRGSGDEQKS